MDPWFFVEQRGEQCSEDIVRISVETSIRARISARCVGRIARLAVRPQ
jgi:hypothetical protein